MFEEKCNRIAAVLQEITGDDGLQILGVCEIEKDTILQDLIDCAGLKLKITIDTSETVSPTGTSDLRGIDVALAYTMERLRGSQPENAYR